MTMMKFSYLHSVEDATTGLTIDVYILDETAPYPDCLIHSSVSHGRAWPLTRTDPNGGISVFLRDLPYDEFDLDHDEPMDEPDAFPLPAPDPWPEPRRRGPSRPRVLERPWSDGDRRSGSRPRPRRRGRRI